MVVVTGGSGRLSVAPDVLRERLAADLDRVREALAAQARRLSTLVEAEVVDDLCRGCPCVACQEVGAVGLCKVYWTTRHLPSSYVAEDVCLSCLLTHLDGVLREAPEYVQVQIWQPAPWLLMTTARGAVA